MPIGSFFQRAAGRPARSLGDLLGLRRNQHMEKLVPGAAFSGSRDEQFPEGTPLLPTLRGYHQEALRGTGIPELDVDVDPEMLPGGKYEGAAGYFAGGESPEKSRIRLHPEFGQWNPRYAQSVADHETAHAVDRLSPGYERAKLLKGQRFDDESQGPLHPNRHRDIMSNLFERLGGPRLRTTYADTPEVRQTYGTDSAMPGFTPRVFVPVSPRDKGALLPLTFDSFEQYKRPGGLPQGRRGQSLGRLGAMPGL